ncbi:sigma-70 family RNA polymerase sigma factor [Hymenobacter sp. NBH84]|uniref:Sigma-70 family RNA polymerase sigma factor n=2 Tax=Hymenobacter TaxID=89966 RepID=A0ABR7ML92_9BACT|nr:sigma-70 family RNA polymerase sigma factor [Hymenobacter sp. NBH84]MBC6611515.1 sigma-70 family RNA polymerase sigma factor [Hymenobacter citatus]MBO3269756.1 sigma-70 family RNA polymerase sigma factor [Hymenobacter defluvii]QNE39412.1 sigma-70 family RNA polymerase sigma factor [Hymenobacter sp. NBH84]
MTDADLIAACRQGNSRAQKLLYERFAGLMLSVCLRYLRHREDAEEVMIGGFVKVFRALDQYRHEGSFEGWIRRIMVNEALGQLRRKEPLHLAIDDVPSTAAVTPATADTQLQADDMLALLAELPAGYRTVFNLYALEGYSHPEIAELLGISEGTSKSQLSKARAMLQRRLTVANATAISTTPPKEYYATGRY